MLQLDALKSGEQFVIKSSSGLYFNKTTELFCKTGTVFYSYLSAEHYLSRMINEGVIGLFHEPEIIPI